MSEIIEVSGESQYVAKSDAEIRSLANDVVTDRVFASWDVLDRDASLLPSIFLPIALMNDFQRKEMQRDGIIHLYGYIPDALPLGINGYPCFSSVGTLNSNDAERLRVKVNALKAAMDSVE